MFSRIWRTKTFWTGIIMIIGGVGGLATGSMEQKTAMEAIIGGLLAMFARDAIEKSGPE